MLKHFSNNSMLNYTGNVLNMAKKTYFLHYHCTYTMSFLDLKKGEKKNG